MLAKVVNGRNEQIYPCDYLTKEHRPDGITIELCGATPHTVELPRDGDAVYITNELGETVAIYRWPERGATSQ